MRITKEPEERKQEILDAAMGLFHKKGYEKTSITDIAKEIGVAQGLCYRYFPSKEALFDSAVDRYAQRLVNQFSPVSKNASLKQTLEEMPFLIERDHSDYYKVFHEGENKKIHDQLALRVCEKLVPQVTKLLEDAQAKNEICLNDIGAAAAFFVYGQLGILLDGNASAEEKGKRIRAFLMDVLRL